jgi:hypothetical protein
MRCEPGTSTCKTLFWAGSRRPEEGPTKPGSFGRFLKRGNLKFSALDVHFLPSGALTIRIAMLTISNPFAALLDPTGILSACAQSGTLDALPVSAKRCADRMSPHVAGELAEHDAAVDEIYLHLVTKAAKAPPAKAKKVARPKEA